jgi:release factor glutamine methyltransferase
MDEFLDRRPLHMDLQELLPVLSARLTADSDTPSLDAQVLVAHVLEKPRSWVLAHPEAVLNPLQARQLDQLQERLLAGVPLPYVLGHWEFFGLDFMVTPAVLIPRPETELLVEAALGWLASIRAEHITAADIGTGSGCIAVSLAVHQPHLGAIATDISLPALQIARRNVLSHHVAGRVHLVQADLLAPLAQSDKRNGHFTSPERAGFQLICANLPYIPSNKLRGLKVNGREPILALDGGMDGLDLIAALLRQVCGRLAPGGRIFMEIEANQGQAARSLARQIYPQATIQILPDLAGKDRVLIVEVDPVPVRANSR